MKILQLLPAVLFLGAALLPSPLLADVTLATPFRDGAVLQRGKLAPVWGMAAAGEKVLVEFSGQTKETAAAADGRWSVKLDRMEANATPTELRVTGGNAVVVKDVVVGEVWLCSGQSNMHLPVSAVVNAEREIAEANHPLIREFVAKTGIADQPQAMVDGAWQACSPSTVSSFTAVGYFFARELHRELQVPVGIIHATLGGSPIEAWMSAEALAGDAAFVPVAQRWEALRPRAKGDSMRNQPSGLYNGFIAPMQPLAMAGFLWYQGEGNSERADEYARLFTTMIPQWRKDFREADLPFLFVQLPGWEDPRDAGGDSWPRLREAQASALTLPHTGMAVTLDVGDPKDLHPRNKQEVGRRLALMALAKVYGKQVEDSGPVPAGMVREGANVRVTFVHAEGLEVVGDAEKMFEVAGADGKFVPARVRIEGDAVVLSCDAVPQPEAVRYAWKNNPPSYLVNRARLVAGSFRRSFKAAD